jgi:hypothetical protein
MLRRFAVLGSVAWLLVPPTSHSSWTFLEFWKDHDQPKFDYSIQYAYLPPTVESTTSGNTSRQPRACAST